VDSNNAAAPAREGRGKRFEWTGAGGDYFLAVIVDDRDEVVAERWGTRQEVLGWMETDWPSASYEIRADGVHTGSAAPKGQ